MLIWDSEALSIRQWNPICYPTIGEIVYSYRNKANIHLGRTPTNEWEGQVGIQGPIKRTEEEIGKGKGKLVKRNSKNFVVLSHHPAIKNEGNAIQLSIWAGCHDTSRGIRKFS